MFLVANFSRCRRQTRVGLFLVHLLRRYLGLVLAHQFLADGAAVEGWVVRSDVDATDAVEEAVHALREVVDH